MVTGDKRNHGKLMKSSELGKGDILCFTGFTGLSLGQGILKLFSRQQGSANCMHCAMVTSPIEGSRFSFIHATSQGLSLDVIQHNAITAFFGNNTVYCYRYKGGSFPKWQCGQAAAIANRWLGSLPESSDTVTTNNIIIGRTDSNPAITYSSMKASKCAFHSASYGQGARQRAERYQEAMFNESLPISVNDPSRPERVFYSMLVVAIWQAALGPERSASDMALDAIYTSPMKLHGFLENSDVWNKLGTLE